jgi:hypothetical protein
LPLSRGGYRSRRRLREGPNRIALPLVASLGVQCDL